MGSIGENIKRERIKRGMTQQELTDRLGCKSRAIICRMEKSKNPPSLKRIKQIADILGCTLNDLIDDLE